MRIIAIVIGTGMLVSGLPALSEAPLPREVTGQRVQDTASPDTFAPDLDRAFRRFQARPGASAPRLAAFDPPLQIGVVFHVLSGPALEGDVSESVLLDQMSALNDAYGPAGMHFNLAEVRRYPGSPYFAGGCFPTTEQGIRMKSELAVDPARFVNVYTCKLDLPYIAGYGTLPNEYPEGDHQHGIIVDYGTVPGSAAPLDLGHTLVHEMGHYFGLFHTFEGGCAEPGDGVADTPAEASPAYGCPIGRDTCADAGADPVANFMDYSDDRCTNQFTPLQNARIQASIATYRPGLLASAFSIGPGMTGNWYNPDQSGHGFGIEVLPGNRMLAEWFVFGPNSGPAWVVATGPISGNTAVLEGQQKIGAGGRFPPNFDPAQLQSRIWGTLTFTFTDCNHGTASWQPVVAGYSAGSMSVTRLTLPAGLSCP